MKKNLVFSFLALTFFINVSAQVAINSSWTWVHGNNTYNVPAVYGTMGVPSMLNNPGLRSGCASWTDGSGKFWFFGGYLNDYMNDLWKYDPVTDRWTWVSGRNVHNDVGTYGTKGIPSVSNIPAARRNATEWTDASGNFWIFGGTAITSDSNVPFGIESLNDLWRYNPITNEWTWMSGNSIVETGNYGVLGTESPTNVPGARQGAMGWVDNSGYFWVFGGDVVHNLSLPSAPFNDMWKYNPSNNQWTWVHGPNTPFGGSVHIAQGIPDPSNIPFSRSEGSTFKDINGNFWLFGGSTIANTWGDIWKFNSSSGQWTWMKGDPDNYNVTGSYGSLGVAAYTNNPGARYRAAGLTDPFGNLWVMGGEFNSQTNGNTYNDLWRYNILSNLWTWVKGDNTFNVSGVYGTLGSTTPTNKPGSRYGSGKWSDAAGNLWIYGGYGSDKDGNRGWLSDLWKISTCSDVAKPSITGNAAKVTEGTDLFATFKLKLSNLPSCQMASVDYTTKSGTAIAGQDYTAVSGTATFLPGSKTVIVLVPILNDGLDEDKEEFTLELSNPIFATLSEISVNCKIDDDDPEPSLSINDLIVNEDVDSARLTINLSAPSGKEIRLKYKTIDGSAVHPDDFIKVPKTELIIPAGSTSITAAVKIINDAVNEPAEDFTVQLSNAHNATIADDIAIITILDGTQSLMARSIPKIKENLADINTALDVKVFGNPSASYFSIRIQTSSSERIILKVFDISGRMIETKSDLKANQIYRIGSQYKNGIYIVEVTQGTERKVIKLVKE